MQMSNAQQRQQFLENEIGHLQKDVQGLSQYRLPLVVPKAAPMKAEPVSVASAAAKPVAKQRPREAMQALPVPEVVVQHQPVAKAVTKTHMVGLKMPPRLPHRFIHRLRQTLSTIRTKSRRSSEAARRATVLEV